MRKMIFAALLAGTLATPALAQDASPFGGLRVEGVVGYDRADVAGGHKGGVTYGAGVGYDMQMGGAIIGVEAEATESTVDKCTNDFALVGDQLCGKINRDLYVGGRAGAVVGSSTLLYAKAGYVNGRVKATYEDGTAGTAADFRTSDNLDGVRVGGGVEQAIGPNSFVKAEYRYSNYEQGLEKHQGVVGFGFRF